MKITMQNNGDGTLTFTIPDHDETPSKTVALADYTTGARLRADIMAWGKGYGATEAEGF